MTTDRIMLEAFEKGKSKLTLAEWGNGEQCMCGNCSCARQAEIAPQVFRDVYPQLRFIPEKFTRFKNYKDTPQEILENIYYIRRINNTFVTLEGQRSFFCKWCGQKHHAHETRLYNGKHYCSSCEYDIFQCSECWEINANRKKHTLSLPNGESKKICAKCAKKLVSCSSCNGKSKREHAHYLPSERDEVGDFVIYILCRNCFEGGVRKCDICGDETHDDVATNMHSHFFCPACAEEQQGIQEFSYKPLRKRFMKAKNEGKVSRDAFHMGFELEVAPHHSFLEPHVMVHLMREHVGRKKIYAMNDGSISQAVEYSSGMEVASYPFTWGYYKKNGIKDWDKLCLFLRSRGWKANHPGLGIHVHTTKAAWGTHQIYKLLKFVHDNRVYVQMVAQRGSTMYCNYNNFDPTEQKLVAKEKLNRQENHYNAINLNNGDSGLASKTIEFRMFQATLEPLYFHKNIEFTYACWLFTASHSAKEMKAEKFDQFILKRRREFPCLCEFLQMCKIKLGIR